MIQGVAVKKLVVHSDDRGTLMEVLRCLLGQICIEVIRWPLLMQEGLHIGFPLRSTESNVVRMTATGV